MSHAFLSYSRGDQQFVERLRDSLRTQKGFQVWMDRDMTPAAIWPDSLSQGLRSCGAVVALLSPRVTAISYVVTELSDAKKLSKPIIPVLIEPCMLSPGLAYLNNMQWVDFSRDTFLSAVEKLSVALMSYGVMPRPLPAPPPPKIDEVIQGTWNIELAGWGAYPYLFVTLIGTSFNGYFNVPSGWPLPEIQPYSGGYHLDRNEIVMDGSRQAAYGGQQWREVFNFTNITISELRGFRPPENAASTWRRQR